MTKEAQTPKKSGVISTGKLLIEAEEVSGGFECIPRGAGKGSDVEDLAVLAGPGYVAKPEKFDR